MKFMYVAALASAALLHGAGAPAPAAPTPVSIDFTALRAIQTHNLDEKGHDQVFVVVDGVVAGEEFHARYPEGGKTWTADSQHLAFSNHDPITLWKGTLNDGQFALVSVSVFQGTGKDQALLKEYRDSIIAAGKKVAAYDKKTIAESEFNALTIDAGAKVLKPGELIQNQRKVIKKIKCVFNRDDNTDHYGGLFTVALWNDGKEIHKRLVPVGLTLGRHYGLGMKIYSKLKYSRKNVYLKDDKGRWRNDQQLPVQSEDEKIIRVKMLENEPIDGEKGSLSMKTTDYMADITVSIGGQTAKWDLEGEVRAEDPNNNDFHTYYEFAD